MDLFQLAWERGSLGLPAIVLGNNIENMSVVVTWGFRRSTFCRAPSNSHFERPGRNWEWVSRVGESKAERRTAEFEAMGLDPGKA